MSRCSDDDADGLLDEGAATQRLDLKLEHRAKAVELESGEGLLTGQGGLTQMACDAVLSTGGALWHRELVKEGLVREVRFGSLQHATTDSTVTE